MLPPITLVISNDQWEPMDAVKLHDADYDERDGRLICRVDIAGVPFHVEAIPVVEIDDDGQRGADGTSDSRLEAFALEFDVVRFRTVTIADIAYVLVMTPFAG